MTQGFTLSILSWATAQSARAVEYTDCNLPNECPAYDMKQSDGEAPVMPEIWGMRSTPSLPSLQGLLWRSRDELISDVLLWTPTHGREKAGRPARTYIQQLCKDTGCSLEDLPEVMNDREKWERGSGISVLPARHDDDDMYNEDLVLNSQQCLMCHKTKVNQTKPGELVFNMSDIRGIQLNKYIFFELRDFFVVDLLNCKLC